MNEKKIKEEWRTVVGYADYEVSSLGAVRSLKYGKVKYMNCSKNKYNYSCLDIRKNGKKKRVFLHRLVWEAFNGPIAEGYEIDHIDGDKSNNTISNLRAVTHRENQWNPVTRVRYLEAMKKLLKNQDWQNKQRQSVRKARAKPIVQLDKNTGEVIRRWECGSDAARELKIDNVSISACCRGKRKTAGGYCWRFDDECESAKKTTSSEHWRIRQREGVRRVCAKPVIQLDVKTSEVIRRWDCIADAARALGVKRCNISLCCNGKQKTAGGYRWRHADDD